MKKINQKVIDKVLQKIEDAIDVNSAMEHYGYSYYHFHRLFFCICGREFKAVHKAMRV